MDNSFTTSGGSNGICFIACDRVSHLLAISNLPLFKGLIAGGATVKTKLFEYAKIEQGYQVVDDCYCVQQSIRKIDVAIFRTDRDGCTQVTTYTDITPATSKRLMGLAHRGYKIEPTFFYAGATPNDPQHMLTMDLRIRKDTRLGELLDTFSPRVKTVTDPNPTSDREYKISR
jgi:hypothetical protein